MKNITTQYESDSLTDTLNHASLEADTAAREIVSTRVFPVPREVMWEAWTNPMILQEWWGPKGFTNTFDEFDFLPGGFWRFTMHGPNGTNYKNESMFLEIKKHERIVFNHRSNPKFQVTVSFENADGKTRVRFRMLFETPDVRESLKKLVVPSNEENFDRLAVALDKMRHATPGR